MIPLPLLLNYYRRRSRTDRREHRIRISVKETLHSWATITGHRGPRASA